MKLKVLFLIFGSWIGMGSCQGTVLALPMLFDNSSSVSCKDANSSGEYISGVVVASQGHDSEVVQAELFLYGHASSREDCNQIRTTHTRIEYYMYTLDFNSCLTDNGCVSWLLLCKERVRGIRYRIDDPTFSAIVVSFTPNFHQCFAVYPLPRDLQLPPEGGQSSYVYPIVHGRHQHLLKGFTIHNPYNTDSVLSLNLTTRAIGLDNGETLIPVGNTLDFKCREVLWVEPDLNSAEDLPKSLSGSVISSSAPLNVFTNLAILNNSKPTWKFELDSQLVHQMPERSHWGKHFVINPRNPKAIPDDKSSCLAYEVTIVSYTAGNSILLKNKSHTTELASPTRVVSDEHYEYMLQYSPSQAVELTYLEIVSTSPIVVLTEAYTTTEPPSCWGDSIYYSTLEQPVEWYANKQIIVLVHPRENITYHYQISIVLPKRDSNPANVLESEQDEPCKGLPVSSYNMSRHQAGDHYVLLIYERSIINSVETQSKFILRHSDPSTRIGVTVFAYAEDLQYSYSNGYSLGGDSVNSDILCPLATAQTNSSPDATVPASLITVMATASALVVIGAVIVKKCKKRHQKRAHKRLLAHHSNEYAYDIFLLCADEDEEFVTECVEKPLNELGYKTMRKNTAPDGLFTLGSAVVSDIDHVTKLCSHVIVVCSTNYTCGSSGVSRDSDIARNHCNIELNYCKELISSCNGRVIPIILDGVGASNFTEFTQHRVRTMDILSDGNARKVFIRKLERDICTINKR